MLNKKKINTLSFLIYLLLLIAFSIYSYSQIDLNLTISSNPFYQKIQQQLITLGYFRRNWSFLIYLIILAGLWIMYFVILSHVRRKRTGKKFLKSAVFGSVFILFFAYPGYSHDYFNYMFDARIVTKYNLNPYFAKAMDFPQDLWTRFMHWTHRTYPYGPIWLLVTLPFSYLGFGKFTITLLNFKLMFVMTYLLNVYLIYRISHHLDKSQKYSNSLFFALNPLVLTESIISPHNESVMLMFLLLFIYFFIVKKRMFWAAFSLILSIGVKFVTFVIVPALFVNKFFFKKNWKNRFLLLSFLLLSLGVLSQVYYREAYPWYFLLLIGFCAVIPKARRIKNSIIFLSIFLSFRYAPFILVGEYNNVVLTAKNMLFYIPLIVLSIYWIIYYSWHLFVAKQTDIK